jgi:murein L,D-transpeptidase YafK
MITFLLVFQVTHAEPKVSLVRVIKHEHKLQLFAGANLLREFRVVFGANPTGHKAQEGDERTPEGSYILDYKKSDSAFYRAIHISYPSSRDTAIAQAQGVKPGGQIMIHGQKNGWGWLAFLIQKFNWTNGCIALTNHDMDFVWNLVEIGTPIEILP